MSMPRFHSHKALVLLLLLSSACSKEPPATVPGGSTRDTTAPVVTLTGPNPVLLDLGSAYVELGATAIDDIDGAVEVTIDATAVNAAEAGVYQVEYTAVDKAGNIGRIGREVRVLAADITPPVIALLGQAVLTIIQGIEFIDPGATATDNRDGDLTVVVTGSVNSAVVGVYELYYSATDRTGNNAAVTRVITVEAGDITAPEVSLNGASVITIVKDDNYVEQGATAIDDRDGEVAVSISGEVDTTIAGSYVLTYEAVDEAGNVGSVIRTVLVEQDVTPPAITLVGPASISLLERDSYTEQGASALDDHDGEVSVNITGAVNSTIPGTYILTYTAADAAENTGSVTRTVVVRPMIPFVTTWKTDNPGISADNQIKIGTAGTGINFDIDWGDGLVNTGVTGDIIHTFAVPGTYTVRIKGQLSRIYFGSTLSDFDQYDPEKLLFIGQWGTNRWKSMASAFAQCKNLQGGAADVPDLSQVRNMSFMFSGASSFNQDIGDWDVSTVVAMTGMFLRAAAFNQDIGPWDVSSVKDTAMMFQEATAFNQDIGDWDVSSATRMVQMFRESAFNQDISTWDVSSVIGMSNMFAHTDFNQNIAGWDVASAERMQGMFQSNPAFNQDIGNWDVSSVTAMGGMFQGASSFNKYIGGWDVSSVTDMGFMFDDALAFNQDIGSWDVSSVKTMWQIFLGAVAFDQDIGGWDISAVTNVRAMFGWENTLSQANYDALLTGWSTLNLQYGLVFRAGRTKYSNSSQAARDVLTGTFGWTVNDGGVAQ